MKTIRRRRLERKTDYKSRLALLKSEKPRLVIRKTNRYMIAQIVESDIAQDKTLFKISSKDLLGNKWPKESPGSLKSLPAAYLTGLQLGSLAKSKLENKEIILDIGMQRSIPKSRIYAVLKGVIDSGIKINHDKEMLPSEEKVKIQGEKK
jgi:large subunit ribosomal protein L18